MALKRFRYVYHVPGEVGDVEATLSRRDRAAGLLAALIEARRFDAELVDFYEIEAV